MGRFMRIKTFADYTHENNLDRDVNDYIENLTGEEVVDIKYSVVAVPDEAIYHSVVLMIERD